MKKKILVVDDDQSILEVLKIILEEAGFMVETSGNSTAVWSWTKRAPDLILLDVLLGEEDGAEICKRLKGKKETRDIPVILFSAHSSGKRVIKECGADCFVSKPFDIDELVGIVRKTLENKV